MAPSHASAGGFLARGSCDQDGRKIFSLRGKARIHGSDNDIPETGLFELGGRGPYPPNANAPNHSSDNGDVLDPILCGSDEHKSSTSTKTQNDANEGALEPEAGDPDGRISLLSGNTRNHASSSDDVLKPPGLCGPGGLISTPIVKTVLFLATAQQVRRKKRELQKR